MFSNLENGQVTAEAQAFFDAIVNFLTLPDCVLTNIL